MKLAIPMKLTQNQKAALLSLADVNAFTVPPANQGQIIEVSYGCSADYIYERCLDRSDRSVVITAYLHPVSADENAFQPWNKEPDLGRRVGVIFRGSASDEPGQNDG